MPYTNINTHTHPQTSNANLIVDDALFCFVDRPAAAAAVAEPLSLVDVSTACVAGPARDTAPLGDGVTIATRVTSLEQPRPLSRRSAEWERRNQTKDRSNTPP